MRVMVILKGSKESESGIMPGTELLSEMGRFNEELVEAGLLVQGEGLHPSAGGKRVRFKENKTEIINGPFGNPSSLIAGFWIWNVQSMDEALSWVKKIPNSPGEESEVEIRPIFEEDDFGEAFTPELRDQEKRLRAQIEKLHTKQKKTRLKVNPYLNFNGTAEAAFTFYRSVFGGQFTALQRFKDMPLSEQPLPESQKEKILHIALPIGEDTLLMGSDIPQNMGQKLQPGNNMYVSLHPESKEETERLFGALSSGGKVEMSLAKVFWGSWFASIRDKFDVQWMINYEER